MEISVTCIFQQRKGMPDGLLIVQLSLSVLSVSSNTILAIEVMHLGEVFQNEIYWITYIYY